MGVPTVAQARTFVASDVHVGGTAAAMIDRESGKDPHDPPGGTGLGNFPFSCDGHGESVGAVLPGTRQALYDLPSQLLATPLQEATPRSRKGFPDMLGLALFLVIVVLFVGFIVAMVRAALAPRRIRGWYEDREADERKVAHALYGERGREWADGRA
jgi:hypothetical protein